MKILTLAVLCSIGGSSAAGPSLDELLERVRAHHPLFSRMARRADVERSAVEVARGAEAWYLRSSARYGFQRPVQTNPFVPKEIQSVDFDVGVERPVWTTGGRASLSWAGSYLRQSTPPVSLGPAFVLPRDVAGFYESGVFVTYSQPLLRNLGGTLDRLPFELASLRADGVQITASEEQEAYLAQVAARYLDWALLTAQQRIAAERLALAEEQVRQSQRKRAQNLIDVVDVLRSQDALQTARQGLVFVGSRLDAVRRELAVIAGAEDLVGPPRYDLYATVDTPAPDVSLETVIGASRLVRAAQLSRQQAQTQLAAAEEDTSADLSLDVGLGARGFDDSSAGEALVTSEPDASVMLSFSYPLGNDQAEAEAERVRLLVRQAEDQQAEVELQLESLLRGLLVQLKELKRVLAIDVEQIAAAEQKAAEEAKMYNRGRSILNFVIQARDDVQRAKLNYAENAAGYQRLLLQYREAVDELLPD